MITGVAHTAVCVPDVESAVRWYESVLGLRVLSPPYRMSGEAMDKDMGELVPTPVVVTAAILGAGDENDRVLEVIEYPDAPRTPSSQTGSIVDPGLTHVGLVCDDVAATRRELEARGVEFLTAGIADIAGLRTTWFHDPWGVVFILMEKGRDDRPYWRQLG